MTSEQFPRGVPADPSRILVGIAATASAHQALAVAAELAEEYDVPLHLVRVWRDVDWFLSARADELPALHDEERTEQNLLVTEYVRARELAPSVPVSCEFVPGSIFAVLLERTESAGLLVLGASSTAGDVGDIGTWYLEHARCAVRIVAADGSTIAGTDPAPAAREAAPATPSR
jgi:nucleotide-binding universal stress UspA family protein